MNAAPASSLDTAGWQAAGPVEVPIEPFADGTYQISEDGRLALSLPVLDDQDRPFDAVAWFPADPGRWWTWLGRAVVLGERAVTASWLYQRPLRLVPTPADWCGADPMSACLLDWSVDPRPHLALANPIEAPAGLANRLRHKIHSLADAGLTIRGIG